VKHLALVLLLAACPSRERANIEESIRTMEAFATKMCACKNKACAEKVQDELVSWSQTTAAKSPEGRDNPPEAQVRRLTAAATKYGTCMTTAMGSAAVIAPPVEADVPPASKTGDADVLMRSATAWVRATYPQHVPVSISIYFADANAMLDDTHGKLYASFGRVAPTGDDPKRKTGAPITKAAVNDCFGLVWDRERGWVKVREQCAQAYEAGIRCSVREIWKRAIAAGAPADALATLTITLKPGTRAWGFWITDEPRGVDISQGFEDDCAMVVEQ
jgi:hypothetical protein